MCFPVILWLSLCLLFPLSWTHSIQSKQYECGPHGRFEYCINNIPGCVVGCHCHPGFYFDTDSKICEPNLKLIQHKSSYDESSHSYDKHSPTATTTTMPTPTTTKKRMNKIANKTDDLGDWLYNQFFKTIENQVINKTNSDMKTRRKGSVGTPIALKKSKRLTRKSTKTSKKKRKKEKALKKKLLRITEDDSLFDTETDDTDTSDSTSSGETDSSSSSSSSSCSDDTDDSDTDSDSRSDKKSKSGHGHKKLIMFNKRPKLPLPSFIFLPNMGTPYYPPIGLPPPPVMPMYPMAPIPPVPAMNPVPGFTVNIVEKPSTDKINVDKSKEEEDKENTSKEKETGAKENREEGTIKRKKISSKLKKAAYNKEVKEDGTKDKKKDSSKEKHEDSSNDSKTDNTDDDQKPNMRKHKEDKKEIMEKEESANTEKSRILERIRKLYAGKNMKLTPKQRIKLIKKLQMKMASRRQLSPIEDYLDKALMSIEAYPPDEKYTPHESHFNPIENYAPTSPDIDFKYLSELIHTVNRSADKKLAFESQNFTNPTNDPYLVESATPLSKSAMVQPRHLHTEGTDDTYYSNLGKQIASIIRTADSKIADFRNKDRSDSVLNEVSFMSHSFSERTIRSPLFRLKKIMDQSGKHSSEKNLINLENEVRTLTHTVNPVGLLEIEDILNKMQIENSEVKNKYIPRDMSDSNINLNINLLPKDKNHRRLSGIRNNRKKYQKSALRHITKLHQQYSKNYSMNDLSKMKNLKMKFNEKTNSKIIDNNMISKLYQKGEDLTQYSSTEINPYLSELIKGKIVSQKKIEYLQFLKNTALKQSATKAAIYHPVKQNSFDSYKPFNYLSSDNKHHYIFDEMQYPLQISTFRRDNTKSAINVYQPSVFGDELKEFN